MFVSTIASSSSVILPEGTPRHRTSVVPPCSFSFSSSSVCVYFPCPCLWLLQRQSKGKYRRSGHNILQVQSTHPLVGHFPLALRVPYRVPFFSITLLLFSPHSVFLLLCCVVTAIRILFLLLLFSVLVWLSCCTPRFSWRFSCFVYPIQYVTRGIMVSHLRICGGAAPIRVSLLIGLCVEYPIGIGLCRSLARALR